MAPLAVPPMCVHDSSAAAAVVAAINWMECIILKGVPVHKRECTCRFNASAIVIADGLYV